ncbi:MAG: EAL domain-containing protein [Dehalococcoidia bacterium]
MASVVVKLWKNLRIRLVLLVLIAVVPGLVINLVLAQNLRDSTADRFVDQAKIVANTVSVFQRDRVAEIRVLLERLSTDTFIHNYKQSQIEDCTAFLGGILDRNPQYANMGMFDANGITLCNGLGTPPGRDNSDRGYYQKTIETKTFAVGEFQIGRSTGLPGINFAYPVFGTGGKIVRVIWVAVLAGSMGDVVKDLNIQESATIIISDESGTILSSVPASIELVGNTEIVRPAIDALREGKSTAYLDDFADFGVRDLVISREIPLVEGVRSGFVFLSIPEEIAFADVNRIILITNLSLGGFLILALGIAVFGLETAVIRPLRQLIGAANQLSTGDLSSRTGLRHGPDEMGQLANSFDGMASALEQRELEITRVESRLSTMMDNIDDGIVSCAPNGSIKLFSRGAERMFGYSAEAALKMSLNDLFKEQTILADNVLEEPLVARTGVKIDGGTFPVEVSFARSDNSGTPDMTAVIRDVTQRVEALEAIERRAYFDIVTELPNRTRFIEIVQSQIDDMGTSTEPFSVIVIQISELQSIEDNFGFDFIERLFSEFAERLGANFGDQCQLARTDADEFALLQPDPLIARDALGFAAQCRQIMEEPFDIESEPVVIGVQIGISFHPGHGSSGENLVHRAAMAARGAESVPERVMLFNPSLEEGTEDRIRILTGIRGALENNELVFHYQPKVNIQNNHVSEVEALVRWESPERGLVPPGLFIPVVESSGYMWPLTAWGIGFATEQLFRWGEDGHDHSISVNVSAQTFRNPQLLSTIESSLTLWGVDPSRLDVEITETAVMSDPDQATRICNILRNMGVTISIDDFGVGQSPLAYLDRLPVNTIKIDREFILNLGTTDKSDKIVESIIRLGRDLGLTVVAEGVEEEPTVETLRQMGCDEIQGYVFAKPTPAEETMAWMTNFNAG